MRVPRQAMLLHCCPAGVVFLVLFLLMVAALENPSFMQGVHSSCPASHGLMPELWFLVSFVGLKPMSYGVSSHLSGFHFSFFQGFPFF